MRPSFSGYHEELFHVRCACHIVNLIVKKRLDLVHEAIQKIGQSIVYLSSSNCRVVSFKIICREYKKSACIFIPN